MKNILLITLLFVISSLLVNAQESQKALINKYEIINKHKQIFDNSCIPSGIEMILKLTKKVDLDFYNYQQIWGNKIDGNFANFDNLLLNGVRFHHKFNINRNNDFPINDLFSTIEKELKEGRYVLISLPSNTGWHMYVICNKLNNGEFVAYSKNGSDNLMVMNVKEIVRRVKGTDIMVYREE